MTIKRKIAIGTVGALCLLTGLAALASIVEAIRGGMRLSEAQAERPASLAAPLSEPNSVTVQLHRKHDLGHGMEIWLEVPGGFTDKAEVRKKLAGLHGFASAGLGQRNGGVAFFHGTNATVSTQTDLQGCVMLGRIQTGATGDGDFHFEIIESAPGLGGSTARVFLRNSYCGLESMLVAFTWFIAAGCAVIALVSGGVTWLLMKGPSARVESAEVMLRP